ncbi:MAG: chromosomal replication initiator protein DnaA [Bacillota bacterium]|nr:chromosomal replication initiator protein DnaA [Bacillota bacterium]
MQSLAQVWTQAVQNLEASVPAPTFHFIRETEPIALHDDTLILGVRNSFTRDYLQDHVALLLQRQLAELLRREVRLEFVVPPETSAETGEARAQDEVAAALSAAVQAHVAQRSGSIGQPLNPRYTFETFVVGSSNRLAHAASLAVADAPARAYNPLFIYGGAGLGKTHLMQAVAHRTLARHPGIRVAYVSCETFANELINAIRDRRTVEFRNRYRNVDVLLVDDIQFLAGKESTQEEFFHTFNALHEANRQIIVSSDRPPKEIPTLEERLRSRFEWGLISDIQPPDFETRLAILRAKAAADNLEIDDGILVYIAEHVRTNIRELEGALIRLVAYTSFKHLPLTLEVAKESLQDFVTPGPDRMVTIEVIQRVVAEYYGLDVQELKVHRRTRAVAYPRQIAMYLCRKLTDASLPKIGEEFGGRDHTTVLHAFNKVEADVQRDPSLAATIDHLVRQIRS